MKQPLLSFLATLSVFAFAQAQVPSTAPVAAASVSSTLPDATAPIPKANNAAFFEQHEKFLQRGKSGPIGVLFLGDSITAGWSRVSHIWEHHFGKYQPANFGIGGDQTQHVIWRIENGELEGISPKAVVLMIGTNNSGAHTGEQIAAGVTRIVELIRTKLPKTKVLLLAIFPRDARRNADGLITDSAIAEAAKRVAANDRANAILAKLDDGKTVRFLNINATFLGKDGRIPWTIMPDQLHLTPAGYQLWADAIDKPLAELMK